jgi:hypothetical protein
MEMMKRLLGILVMTLLIATALPAVGTINNEIKNYSSLGGDWSDNFDNYTLGQELDGDPEDGGWKGWDNNPNYGATIIDSYYHSPSYSVKMKDNSDIVHEFSGYTTGQYIFTAWQFSHALADFEDYYFILLSDYSDGGPYKHAVQICFDRSKREVVCEYDGKSLPLILDEWVEIRVNIDLDTDWMEIYYGGDLLHEKPWTAGVNNEEDGLLNIAAVNLAQYGSPYEWPGYFDSLSLIGANYPPNEPTITGPPSGNTKKEYEFTFKSVDPDGDNVKYFIDWGDTKSEWTGFYPSGTVAKVKHSWSSDGAYNIIAKAQDEYGAESTETAKTITITTPRHRTVYHPLLLQLFERFPYLFPILRQLSG